MKIKIFWAQSLGKTSDLPDLVESGGVDMSMLVPGYYPSRFPLAMASNQLWWVNQTADEAYAVANTIYWEGPIKEEYTKQNMKVIYVQVRPYYHLWTWQPLRTIEDLKGKKIRSWGPYMPKLYDYVGAVGVNLVQADWFEAMQKHMVDAGVFAIEMGLGSKVDEVAKYVTMLNLGVNTGPVCVMNLDKWKSLPDDIKAVFEEVMKEMPTVGRQITDKFEKEAIAKLPSLGITAIEFPDRQKWIDKLPDFRLMWLEDMKKKGLGDKAEEVLKLWKKAVSK